MVAAACSGDSFADATACVSEGGVAWLLFVVVGIGVHDALMRGGDDVYGTDNTDVAVSSCVFMFWTKRMGMRRIYQQQMD